MKSISLVRGILSIVVMNVVSAVPFFLAYASPKHVVDVYVTHGAVWVALLCGLAIAFGRACFARGFWLGGESFLPGLQQRAFTLLPLALAGLTASIFVKSLFVADPVGSIPSLLEMSVQSTLVSMILLAMLWQRLGARGAGLLIAGLLLLMPISSFCMRARAAGTPLFPPEQILLAVLGMASQTLFIIGTLKMLENTRWGPPVVMAYTFVFVLLDSVFFAFHVHPYGSAARSVAAAASGALLCWNESREEVSARARAAAHA